MFYAIKKRRHFKKRLKAVSEAIWDLEFQREKLRMLREDIRAQYDRLNEQSEMAKRKIEDDTKAGNVDPKVIANLQAIVDKYAPDLEYKKKQIEGLDQEIDGEGNAQSCDARIEGFRSLKAMYKEYMKRI